MLLAVSVSEGWWNHIYSTIRSTHHQPQSATTLKPPDRWSDWHWSQLQYSLLAVDPAGSSCPCEYFLTLKAHLKLVSDKIKPPHANSTPLMQHALSCWGINVIRVWRCPGECAGSADVFGWMLCVTWHPHEFQDLWLPSKIWRDEWCYSI